MHLIHVLRFWKQINPYKITYPLIKEKRIFHRNSIKTILSFITGSADMSDSQWRDVRGKQSAELTSGFTLQTVMCRTPLWSWRSTTGLTPAALNVTCSYHYWNWTEGTHPLPPVDGGRSVNVTVFWKRRQSWGWRRQSPPTPPPSRRHRPSDNWDGSCRSHDDNNMTVIRNF